MMTREERKQRAKERAEEKRQWAEKYPRASLSRDGRDDQQFLGVSLHPDEPSWLNVRYRGDPFRKETLGGDTGTHIAGIWLNDPRELARFIRALVARYNAMVEDLNETVESIPRMKRAIGLEELNGESSERDYEKYWEAQGFTTRTRNCIMLDDKLRNPQALLAATDAELLRIKNFGQCSLEEVNEWRDRNTHGA
jgi:hypothetical protein